MVKGFAGKILRVDLTHRRVTVEEPEESFYRLYLGGAGFVSYFLLKELPGGIDPLGPENKLIFAVGPMTGLPLGGATRDCAGARSPLTGGGIKSEAGGIWPMEFKRTGYDALIVEGVADQPVYLWINSEGAVEIRDAGHLWGLDVLQTHEAITQRAGRFAHQDLGHWRQRRETRSVRHGDERPEGRARTRRPGCGHGLQEAQGHRCARHQVSGGRAAGAHQGIRQVVRRQLLQFQDLWQGLQRPRHRGSHGDVQRNGQSPLLQLR